MSRAEISHLLGVVGYALMLWAAFGYSWRKSLARRGPGPTRAWMDAHVAAGILGPALVLVHTGWGFSGLAGVTMLLTLVLVASGAVGRWVYTRLPALPPPNDDIARIDAELAGLTSVPLPELEWGGGVATLAPGRVERAVVEARIRTLRELRVVREREQAVSASRARWRRWLAGWWLLHVPLSLAVLVLALVHSLAALYFGR